MTCEAWTPILPCDVSGDDPDLVDAAVAAGTSILWAMTGRRFGLCSTTEWYRSPCSTPCTAPYADEFGPGVEWRLGAGRRRACCAIALEQTPVRSIDEVLIDGVAVDPDTYYLGRSRLYRIGECWPCETDCEVPPVAVSYTYGIDVPVLGQMALGELACELLRGWTGADCRLPSNAVAVTRQGVTVDLGTPEVLFEQNRLGLPISDQFIRSVNPDRLRSASRVYSPDVARRVR